MMLKLTLVAMGWDLMIVAISVIFLISLFLVVKFARVYGKVGFLIISLIFTISSLITLIYVIHNFEPYMKNLIATEMKIHDKESEAKISKLALQKYESDKSMSDKLKSEQEKNLVYPDAYPITYKGKVYYMRWHYDNQGDFCLNIRNWSHDFACGPGTVDGPNFKSVFEGLLADYNKEVKSSTNIPDYDKFSKFLLENAN